MTSSTSAKPAPACQPHRRSMRPLRQRGSAVQRARTPLPTTRRSPALLTVEQVAERCAVSKRTTRRWIEAGELRAHRLGQLVRVSEDDLAAFLAARRDL